MPELNYDIPPLGGLKRDLPSQLLERHYSPSLNAVWPFNGRIRRMPGKKQLSSVALDTSGGVQGMYMLELDDGSAAFVACSREKAYQYNAVSGIFDSLHTSSDSGFTGGEADLFDFAPFFDSAGTEILVLTNGVDSIKKWLGTGYIEDLGGTPDKCKYLEPYQNYLMKAGIANAPRQLQWTDLGNGENHPVENYIDFFKTTDIIMRPKTLRDSLVVYKSKSISIVDYVGGDLIFRNRENYIDGHGLIGSRSVQNYGYGAEVHYYIGSDFELHRFDLIEAPPVSKNISQILINMEPSTWAGICSIRTTQYDKLMWAIPGRGVAGNYDLLIYDLKTNSFWIREGEPRRIMSMVEGREGSSTLTWDSIIADTWDEWDVPGGWDAMATEGDVSNAFIAYGCDDGIVRMMVAGLDDDGTAMESHFKYPFDNLDGSDRSLKQLKKIIVETSNEGSGEVKFSLFKDNNDQNEVTLNDDGDTSATLSLTADDANALYVYHEIDVSVIGYNFAAMLASEGAVWSGRVVKWIYEYVGNKIV